MTEQLPPPEEAYDGGDFVSLQEERQRPTICQSELSKSYHASISILPYRRARPLRWDVGGLCTGSREWQATVPAMVLAVPRHWT